jgi:DNA-binding response OmpR family regulator
VHESEKSLKEIPAFYRIFSDSWLIIRTKQARKAMRILVIEDEPRMVGLLRQALVEEGHSVTTATEGREGLSLAESCPFDLIILDVMLPGIDGFTVARRLRARLNQTPILMLTARDAAQDIIEGLDLGADD